jgi:hypothetical protein
MRQSLTANSDWCVEWGQGGGAIGSTGVQGSTGVVGETGFICETGTSAVIMGNKINVYSNLTTSNNYCMVGYISAPNNPLYGLYTFTFYFNGPTNSLNYSSLVITYYLHAGAIP